MCFLQLLPFVLYYYGVNRNTCRAVERLGELPTGLSAVYTMCSSQQNCGQWEYQSMTTTIELNTLLSDRCNIIIFKYCILCLLVAFNIPKLFCYKRRLTVIHVAHSMALVYVCAPHEHWFLWFILQHISEYVTSDTVRLMSNELERICNEAVVT